MARDGPLTATDSMAGNDPQLWVKGHRPCDEKGAAFPRGVRVQPQANNTRDLRDHNPLPETGARARV